MKYLPYVKSLIGNIFWEVTLDNLYDILNNRASCRNFINKEIADELLNKIIDAACKAPSSGGFQTYSIIKVKNSETKRELSRLCRNQMFIEKASVCLVFCIDYRRIKQLNEVIPAPCDLTNQFMDFWMSVIDTAICAQTMCIVAEAEGLKSVFIGNIINTIDRVSSLLKLPKYVCPSIMVVLGYPKNKSVLSKKYDAKIIVHEEEYKDIEIKNLINEYKKKYENWNMKPTVNMIDKIYDTCCKLQGIEFADQFKNYVLEYNNISPYQFWLGYYYLRQEGFLDFQGYKDFMKRQGFNWLE